jgi:hypothetical protein
VGWSLVGGVVPASFTSRRFLQTPMPDHQHAVRDMSDHEWDGSGVVLPVARSGRLASFGGRM